MLSSQPCRGTAIATVMVLACAVLSISWPSTARAQQLAFVRPQKAVGVALYYRWGAIEVLAPSSSADPQTKGLIDTLPDTMPLQGPTFAVSFGDFGIVAAYSIFAADINKGADITGDNTPDLDVIAVQGDSVSMSLLYQPINHFFIGYGTYRGTLAFQLVSGGVGMTRKSATSGYFYTIALAWGVDPTVRKSQFFFSIYAAPSAGGSDEVVVSSYGVGMGAFF